jgi:hypothetical protein
MPNLQDIDENSPEIIVGLSGTNSPSSAATHRIITTYEVVS